MNRPDNDYAIKVSGLEKWFGHNRILDNVAFNVPAGQVAALLGPNGAGKTTTLRILAGTLSFDAGEVVVQGLSLRTQRDEALRKIGYMPENPPLYPELTVRGLLRFWAGIRGQKRSAVEGVVDETIASCGLEDVADVLTKKLSKGYRQRLGLAQAIVHNPSVLILDEPTAGLDPDYIFETRSLVRSLAGSKTVLVSTHILPDAAYMCDYVLIMDGGRIVAQTALPAAKTSSPEAITALERLYLDAVHKRRLAPVK